jgi:hypothetical protein
MNMFIILINSFIFLCFLREQSVTNKKIKDKSVANMYIVFAVLKKMYILLFIEWYMMSIVNYTISLTCAQIVEL